MKNFLLPLFILLFFANRSTAQFAVSVGNDTTACQGTTLVLFVDFPGTPQSGNMLYEWTPSTGITTPNGPQYPNFQIDNTITYILKVTDLIFVDSTYDTITITALPNPTTYFTVSDTMICAGNGVGFTSTTTGGTPPYTYGYNFANGDGTNANQQDAFAYYSMAGSYNPSLLVTDANGCTNEYDAPYNIAVWGFSVNALLTPIICHGDNNGSMIAVLDTDGLAPFTFMWSNGATTQAINNLSPGAYQVTVVDAHGCAAIANNFITEPPLLEVLLLPANQTSANACDGFIHIVPSGGVMPYSYNWTNGSTIPGPSGLCAGIYEVTVTDANGCTAISSTIISSDSACNGNNLAVSINSQDLSCTHLTDTLHAVVTGGYPPYQYDWNFPLSSNKDTAIITNSGVYLVWVTDSIGCTKTAIDTVLNAGVAVSLVYATPTTCNGNPVGAAKINVTGGTPPYTYLWSNGATADSIVNVVSNTYIVTVTDANTCTAILDVIINQNSTNWSYYVYINTTPANCTSNGAATANIYGGTPPYSYLWNTGDTTPTITGLAPGSSHTVTVTGNDGCTRSGSAYIYANCNNIITGNVFFDTNSNCVQDSGELPANNAFVVATGNGGGYYGYTTANGSYTIMVPANGNFTVTFSANTWANGCSNINLCGAQTVSFAGLGDSATANFGLGSSSGFNLSLHPGWHSANPGFQKDYWALYFQNSQPIYAGAASIIFTYDSMLVFNSCNNNGVHNANAHTITWTVNSVPYPGWDWNTVPRAYFTVPANLPVGYQLMQDFRITPYAGDCDTTDNHLLVVEPVTGSRDPNEKDVSPAGDIQEEDSVLTYTIHFQNTGNDTTYFITVKDTLSQYVNPATVVNLASSHEYTSFNVSENGILTWLFNPIFLVDSFTNEAASKGFVMFKVKKKPGLPLNTEIKNRAHIYFDYNEPVVTNTVSSKLSDPNSVYNVTNDASIQVTAAPNPFTQQTQLTVEGITGAFNFELFDVSGKLLQKKNGLSDNRFTINRENMSAGIYFYSITTTAKQKAFGRLVVE